MTSDRRRHLRHQLWSAHVDQLGTPHGVRSALLRNPQLWPVEAWDGVLAFGPKPLQAPYPPAIPEGVAELVGMDEDCSTLNISTPDRPLVALLEVLTHRSNRR